jgi:hypothetical protein
MEHPFAVKAQTALPYDHEHNCFRVRPKENEALNDCHYFIIWLKEIIKEAQVCNISLDSYRKMLKQGFATSPNGSSWEDYDKFLRALSWLHDNE